MSRLTESAYALLPDYVRDADANLADPHSDPMTLKSWLAAALSQSDGVLEAVDALDPQTAPDGVSVAERPLNAPVSLLPFLALMAGLLPDYAGLPADLLREVLARPAGSRRRGSRQAMAASVASTLTGSQTVEVESHVGGDPWLMRVTVVESEAPDLGASQAAANREKPAGVAKVIVYTGAAVHTHTVGSLGGRGGPHPHTVGQLAGRATGHSHTIGSMVGR